MSEERGERGGALISYENFVRGLSPVRVLPVVSLTGEKERERDYRSSLANQLACKTSARGEKAVSSFPKVSRRIGNCVRK